jgi:hypothetical protein
MIVAQYEVLGNEAKKDTSVSEGTIETLSFWFRTRLSDCHHCSIVPSASGTDSSLKTLTNPALRTGRLSLSPSGTDQNREFDAKELPPNSRPLLVSFSGL